MVGGSAAEVRARADLTGFTVVHNPDFSSGCGSSVSSAVAHVRADALVLLLGDQPGIDPADVRRVTEAPTPIAVCRYDDGLGHPFLFRRECFGSLSELHGDKAVWKLLDARPADVAEVPVPGPVPLDVDTWADYEAVLAG